MLRCCAYSAILIMSFYWIWFPIAASRRNGFQSSEIFTTFYNGINHATDAKGNTIKQASEYVYPMGNKVSRTKVLSHEVLNLTHLVFFANFYLRHTLILLPNALSSYCWTIGVLFGAWEFYGYGVHPLGLNFLAGYELTRVFTVTMLLSTCQRRHIKQARS